jgi:tetratricopeptide (TPR) repeat protein
LNTLDGGEEDADPLSRWGYSSLVVALRKRLAGNLRRTELEEINWGRLGWAYDELGDATQAIECFQRALDIIASQADNTRDNKKSQGKSFTNMGVAYLTKGEPGRAIGFLERALAIDRELDEKVDEARDLGELGCAYAELGDVATAIQLQQQALDIDRRENAVHEVAADLGNLGEVCAQVGELDQALAYHNEALEIDKGQEEDENYLAEDLNNLGTVYIALGDWDRAAEYFRQAVDIVRKTAARDLIAEFAPNLGYALWLRSRDPDAVGYIQQGLQAARAIGNRIREATCLRALGRIHHVSDQLDAAQRSYEQAIQCNAFPSNFQCFVGLGILRLQQGDVKMAQECFTRGIAICRTLLEKTPRLYEVLYHLAAAQLGIGLVGDALANYRQALGICSAKGILELGLQDLQMLQRLPQIPDGLPDAIAILEAARQGSRHGKG